MVYPSLLYLYELLSVFVADCDFLNAWGSKFSSSPNMHVRQRGNSCAAKCCRIIDSWSDIRVGKRGNSVLIVDAVLRYERKI